HGRVTDMLFSVLESPAGAERCSFHSVPNPYAVIGPVFEKILDFSRLIGEAEDDLVYAGAAHKINLIKEKRRICDRHDWFRSIDRKRPEACPLPPGQNESLHTGFLY